VIIREKGGEMTQETAIVTGAAGGIGEQIAKTLAGVGYRIIATDINGDGARALAATLPDAMAIQADLSKKSEVDRLRDEIVEKEITVTHIINAAGIFFTHDITEIPESEFDRIMNINVKSIYLMAQAFIPDFLENGGGNIINIASTAGLRGGRNRAIYSASKAAVISLTRSISVDYGSRGIRCNVICPGLIDTTMAAWITDDQEALQKWEKTISAQRIGEPEDVANAVLFLASPQSSYMYGSTVVVDGGGTA
jgi:NAD(P)-dependent dehydrogenase (short-subunit alcohol dehydrogenase family)